MWNDSENNVGDWSIWKATISFRGGAAPSAGADEQRDLASTKSLFFFNPRQGCSELKALRWTPPILVLGFQEASDLNACYRECTVAEIDLRWNRADRYTFVYVCIDYLVSFAFFVGMEFLQVIALPVPMADQVAPKCSIYTYIHTRKTLFLGGQFRRVFLIYFSAIFRSMFERFLDRFWIGV